jgi:hypothetical protein
MPNLQQIEEEEKVNSVHLSQFPLSSICSGFLHMQARVHVSHQLQKHEGGMH